RDQDLTGRAGNPAVTLELAHQEFAQRPIAERAALEPVGRERRSLARAHRGRCGDELVHRNLGGVVVPAGEIELGESGPARSRGGETAAQVRHEVEGGGGHVFEPSSSNGNGSGSYEQGRS